MWNEIEGEKYWSKCYRLWWNNFYSTRLSGSQSYLWTRRVQKVWHKIWTCPCPISARWNVCSVETPCTIGEKISLPCSILAKCWFIYCSTKQIYWTIRDGREISWKSKLFFYINCFRKWLTISVISSTKGLLASFWHHVLFRPPSPVPCSFEAEATYTISTAVCAWRVPLIISPVCGKKNWVLHMNNCTSFSMKHSFTVTVTKNSNCSCTLIIFSYLSFSDTNILVIFVLYWILFAMTCHFRKVHTYLVNLFVQLFFHKVQIELYIQ